jgi:PAS domain S-box-containing protein
VTPDEQRFEDLRAEAELYRRLFDAANDPIVTFDINGIITAANAEAERILGHPRDALLGHHFQEFIHPDATQRVIETGLRLLAGEAVSPNVEVSGLARDGRQVIAEGRISLMRDARGRPAGWQVIYRDITKRKRVEEERRASEARYRQLVDGSIQGILISRNWVALFANQSLAHMLGFGDAKEMIGRDVRNFMEPADMPRIEGYASARARGEHVPTRYELQGRRRDGTPIWAVVEVSIIEWDGGPATLGTFIDITDRKASEERYRQLVEGSIQGIHIHRNWVTLFANRSLGQMLRVADVARLIGADARAHIHPDDVTRVQAYGTARIRGDAVPSHYEFRLVRTDGSTLWVENSVSVVQWEGGPAILSTLLDVSERKAAQDALLRHETQMRQAQKMEAVGQLAGGVAHDFNNLLVVIQGRAELLLRRFGADERLARDLKLIDTTAQRASALVRQLLAFSRRQVLQPTLIDLNEVVEGVSPMLRSLVGRDIELRTELSSTRAAVVADAVQMEQVLVNLVVNARDAMPNGGRVVLATTRADIDTDVAEHTAGARPGPYVAVTVRDTGKGMSQETMARVFEPFFTTKEPGRGTGLGLSTVYGIIEQSGGFVTVESEPGRGTTFRVYLPSAAVAGADAEVTPAVVDVVTSASTILLVDDDLAVREIVRDILIEEGFAVLEAANGEEAMRVIERDDGTIRLLLTDVVMPRMNGLQLAKNVGVQRPQMPILYMSGHVDPAGLGEGTLPVGAALISKPFSQELLVERVRAALAG